MSNMEELRERARKLMQGAYDLHVHSLPSHAGRCVNDLELLKQADALGMAGVMIKNHFEPTEARAFLANLAVQPETARAYGSITLNHPVGGLNPAAVESAARLGARMVWMPTCEAKNDILASGKKENPKRPGLTVLDEKGKLLPAVFEIFEVVRQYGLTIGTGHLSCEESKLLCEAAVTAGVRISFTHPEWRTVKAPLALQKELAAKGVWIEKAWVPVPLGDVSAEELALSIRELGPERVYLVTDHGADYLKTPAEALQDYVAALLEAKLPEADLKRMLQENPREILGENK